MLPKIDVPTFEVMLPFSKQKVKLRPFLVKEQKLLLMAQESDNIKDVIDATRQLIANCCLSNLDVEKLPVFELEYLFLQLRSKSVSEVVQLRYRCKNTVEGKACDHVVGVSVPLNDVKLDIPEKDLSTVKVTPTLGLKLRYPTFEIVQMMDSMESMSYDDVLKLIAQCVEFIFDDETVYDRFTIEEAVEFLEQLKIKQLDEIKKFFEHIPAVYTDVKFRCNKCKYEETISLRGLDDFFD